jgi:hypothetical protein
MFLDEKGEKISKSKGNGLSLDEWLTYGSEESLAFYAYREPKSAKQLHLGVIPRAVDEYFQFRGNYARPAEIEKKLGNPVHHIHNAVQGEAVPPGRAAGDLRAAAQSRRRDGAAGDRAAGVGLSLQLCRGCVSRKAIRSSPGSWGMRSPITAISCRPDVEAPQGPRRMRLRARNELDAQLARAARRCFRQRTSRISSMRNRQGSALRVRKSARLVQGAVSDLAGGRPRPAHGQLHRALRDREQPAADCGGSE